MFSQDTRALWGGGGRARTVRSQAPGDYCVLSTLALLREAHLVCFRKVLRSPCSQDVGISWSVLTHGHGPGAWELRLPGLLTALRVMPSA